MVARFYLNGAALASVPLLGQAVADVGVLTPNGYGNVVHFRPIKVTPVALTMGKGLLFVRTDGVVINEIIEQ